MTPLEWILLALFGGFPVVLAVCVILALLGVRARKPPPYPGVRDWRP